MKKHIARFVVKLITTGCMLSDLIQLRFILLPVNVFIADILCELEPYKGMLYEIFKDDF